MDRRGLGWGLDWYRLYRLAFRMPDCGSEYAPLTLKKVIE